MNYEGPIYRPPSEADSLLIQATVGCPHNRCTFCMIYKKGPRYRERAVAQVRQDLVKARRQFGPRVRTLFLPAGNTLAMQTPSLSAVCEAAHELFPHLERITVYGSTAAIRRKGAAALKRLAQAGLSRIHLGIESGDDAVLRRIKKGATADHHIEAGRLVRQAGIELSVYIILGIAGLSRSHRHAEASARVINAISPDFVRLRTFVPKVGTPLLKDVQAGRFSMLDAHQVLHETACLVEAIDVPTHLTSDHYTNYINIEGRLPDSKAAMLRAIHAAGQRDLSSFRPFFIGTQ